MTFEESVVIVTGAGRGIGFGLCKAFAEAGARVALNDIDGELAQQAAESINTELSRDAVTAYALDVAAAGAVQAMVADVVQRHGRLDVAIANAGLSHFGRFLDYTPEAFNRVTAVNLRGTYFTAQAAAHFHVLGDRHPGLSQPECLRHDQSRDSTPGSCSGRGAGRVRNHRQCHRPWRDRHGTHDGR